MTNPAFPSQAIAMNGRDLRLKEYNGEWRILHNRRAGAPMNVIATFLHEEDARLCHDVLSSAIDPTRRVGIVNSQKETQT